MSASAIAIAATPVAESPFALPGGCDYRITQVYRYWQACRPSLDVLPGRRDIGPMGLMDVLRYVWMCDVARNPLRFRYRLIGTTVAHVMGCDRTGGWLDEVHENFAASPAFADFARAAEEGACSYYSGRPMFHLAKDYIWMERLMMPMATDGHTVDMLLGVTLYRAPGA